MLDRVWTKRGPSVFGYEPGWLWWVAALVVVTVGGGALTKQVHRHLTIQEYIDARIAHHAESQGLDVVLVRSVVQAESSRDWKATSPVGAKGLMQVTDIALKDVKRLEGIDDGDLYDIDYNLRVGTLYLAYLMDRFDGDVALAVAAYHMGPTAISRGQRKYPNLSPRDMIDKHGGPQTRAYVKKVLKLIEED
ncbi:MAG: lytic transglycosylase domain-containing protein [Phycisphaeraceae bacterium]